MLNRSHHINSSLMCSYQSLHALVLVRTCILTLCQTVNASEIENGKTCGEAVELTSK